MTRLPFDRKYLAALAIALACVLALAAAGAHAILRLRESIALTQHTREVQNQIDLVHIALLDLEKNQRAFLLTQQTADFESYLTNLRRLHAEMDALAALTTSHAEQGPDLARLRLLVERRRDDLARAVEARRRSGEEAVVTAIREREGQALMDQIRAVLGRMDQEEVRALAAHEAEAGEQLRFNVALGAAVLAVTTVMLAAIYLLMRRELAARNRAERAEVERRTLLEQDIERRARQLARATDALSLSEAQLRGVFESATDAILTIDATQTIVLANPAAARMLRTAREDLVGSALERFVPEPWRAAHRRHIEAFGASAVHSRTMSPRREVCGLRADGELFPVEAAISHARVDGRTLYTVILRDISERQRAEAELRQSEVRFREVLRMLPEPVFIDTGDRLGFVNEAAQRLVGRGESELSGRSLLSLCHPDSVPRMQACIARLAEGPAVATPIEIEVLAADASVRVVEATAARIDYGGQVSVIVMTRDVSDLRRVQRELERSHTDLQRLMSAQGRVQEEERRRIARELHDDLQQKLAAILMNLSAARRQGRRESPAAQGALAAADELAAAAIESTRRIVNDLRPQVLDDLGLVPALQALAQGFSRGSGVACRVQAEAAAAERAAVSTDVATCLYRVAQESLTNVAKHSQATEVRIELETGGERDLVLRVRDNGLGMALESRRKSDSFGLLGMEERLHRVGGRLEVHSLAGVGTTVEARVPMPRAG
ncbi:MAG TPA: PAS domain S-box protein [Burkholderiaceae bacterium]|nr:PAS domain S-box protein [Burkholderiaceae bacterium]